MLNNQFKSNFLTNGFLIVVSLLILISVFSRLQQIGQPKVTAVPTLPTSIPITTPTPLVPTVTIFPSPSVKSQPIPSMVVNDPTNWIPQICGQLSFKIPDGYDIKCLKQSEGDGAFIIKTGQLKWSFYISSQLSDAKNVVQFWNIKLNATPDQAKKYTRSRSQKFGQNSGIDFFADIKYWPADDPSPILLSFEKNIVMIFGGRNFDSQTGEIIRSKISDTIASTIKIIPLP